MKGRFCFILLLLANFSATAQEYLWPTDASQHITSSFCESRSRRFHAAIDIKTWNRVGFKIFAVRSGYVERMAISPYGYGRALYLRLDTGETVVYAHLEGFNEKLQAIAEQEQERVGRYRIDKFFRPETLPVQQGEVLGYTGQSGIGTPHLHFELRDSRNRPVNPFLRGFKIVDTLPPTVTQLAVSPLAPGAMVNGDFLPGVWRPFRQNGVWRVAEPIHIAGKVGVAIDGYDQAEGAANRFGFYRLQLFVDDTLQFQTQFDSFDYPQNKLVELDRDFLLSQRGFGDFHRLYRVAGNALGFYSHRNSHRGTLVSQPDEHVLNHEMDAHTPAVPNYQALSGLSVGEHRLRVIAEDFFGNRAMVEAGLVVGSPFTIAPQMVANPAGPWQLQSIQAPPARQIQKLEAAVANVSGLESISPWRPIAVMWPEPSPAQTQVKLATQVEMHAATNIAVNDSSRQNPSALELQTAGASLLRLLAFDQYGLRSQPIFISRPPTNRIVAPLLLDVEWDFYPNYLRLLIRANQPLAKAPIIKFSARSRTVHANAVAQQPHRYIAAVPLADIAGDSVHLEVVADGLFGQQEMWQDWFMNALVQPGRGRSWLAPDGGMRVAFSEDAVYSPLYGRVSIDTVTHISHRRVIGPIYRVEPQDVPLNDGAIVTISYPDSILQPKQLGICRRSDKSWVFIDSKVNPANRTVSARVYSMKDFALMRDDEPPALSIRTPHAGMVTQNRRPLIAFEVNDSTSGFESEEFIELRLDGQKLIAEYDPEREVVQYRPKKDITPGVHKLTARAEDRCGNVARREIEFTVR